MVAVGLGGAGRTGVQVDGSQRKQQRQEVGEIMSGLREQCQGVGADAGNHQQHDVRQGYDEGDAQDFGSPLIPAMNVHVHPLSLRGVEAGFKARLNHKGH